MAFHNVPPNGFPDLPDMEEVEAVVKDVATLKNDVSDLNDTKVNQITIAPFFNSETAYEVGDLVYYNGLSYRCTNAHEGEWDADDFAATTVANELAEVKSGLTNLVILETYSDQTSDIGGNILIGNKTGYVPIAVQLTTYTASYAIQANPSFFPDSVAPQWLVNLQYIDGGTNIGYAANVACSFNVWWMKVN